LKKLVITLTAAALGLVAMPRAEAASGPRCGDRLTRNTVLTKDLYCQKDGLKIGAHGITLDLNGHDIIGPGKPGTKGIQNSGYDNVVIDAYAGGIVRGFDHGIELRNGADDNAIIGFYSGGVRGGTYGLVLFDSDGVRVDDNFITAGRWKDGYDGGFGAAFALYRSHDNWFEENWSWGNGVNTFVVDNSRRNSIVEFNYAENESGDETVVPANLTPSRGTGLMLRNSDENWIAGTFAKNANDGIFLDSESNGNIVGANGDSGGGNLAVGNGKLGINNRGKNIDGGGNVAYGNGWSAQCRGIVCTGQ
jgi:hypothetical protein